jgi:hypothetical protein
MTLTQSSTFESNYMPFICNQKPKDHIKDQDSKGIKIEAITQTGETKIISVSDSHGIIRVDASVGAVVTPAEDIHPGDIVMVDSSNDSHAKVVSAKKYDMSSRIVLYTEDGTVIANGIHAATSCGVGNEMILEQYKLKNEKEFDQKQCAEDMYADRDALIYAPLATGDGKLGIADVYEYVSETCTNKKTNALLLETVGRKDVPKALWKDNAALINILATKAGYSVGEAAVSLNPYTCPDCMNQKSIDGIVADVSKMVRTRG